MTHNRHAVAFYSYVLFAFNCVVLVNADERLLEPITLVRVANDVAIQFDGNVSETEWQLSSLVRDFRLLNHGPDEMVPASQQTVVRLLYNDYGLYVAFELTQPESSLVKIHSAQDRGSSDRDFVTVALDTSGSGQYGNYFTLYLGGSKGDGVLEPEKLWVSNWDGAWVGRTAETSAGWSAEIFIPWSILSLPKNLNERRLGFFFARKFAQEAEYYGFPALHNDAPRFLSDFAPAIVENLSIKRQLSIFPFISSHMDVVGSSSREHYGVDVFWRPTTHFQITGALQPDFGTVEADDVIINLSAFESFFPDRRLFFVEGREIFLPTLRAYGSLVPFHSRRIGDRPNIPQVDNEVEVDLSRLTSGSELYGALKGTGQIQKFRYGILGAWEKDAIFRARSEHDTFDLKSPGRSFGVLRLLYENNVRTRYGVGMLSVVSLDKTRGNAYTHSIDARFQSQSGRLRTESQVLVTEVAHQDAGYAGFTDVRYRQSDTLRHSLAVSYIDPEFDLSRTGFASRGDRLSMQYSLSSVQYQTTRIQQVNHSVSVSGSWNSLGTRTDASIGLAAAIRDRDQNSLSVSVNYKPSYVDDATAYRKFKFHTRPTSRVAVGLSSNSTKKFHQVAWLSFQEGRIQGRSNSLGVQLGYRPRESLAFSWSLSKDLNNGLVLHQGNREFIRYRSWSPTSNFAIQFFPTTRQQIRLDLQCRLIQAKAYEYLTLEERANKIRSIGFEVNGNTDDFSISRTSFQLRYRWEIAPLSDLFVVYTRTGALDATVRNAFLPTLRETIRERNTENLAVKFRWRTALDY
ncbi:MAG: hypothetical protein F4Z14_02910 [Gammaproteobacteria bacterium]|nr:hypothetical protein [Gammaproteobacteria bacterium]